MVRHADHRQHYFTIYEQYPELHDQLRAMALLDIIANNTDRKSGHCLLVEATDTTPASVWGIDNGLCFAPEYKLRTVIWEFAGEPIPDALLEPVARLCATRAARDRRAAERCRGRGDPGPSGVVRQGAGVPDRSERPALPVAAGIGPLPGERRRTARRADPPRRPRRPGADDRRPLLDQRLGRPAAAARRARHAVETGRQLWPAATLAEYRLALLAPPPFVAAVLDESDGLSGRFTIGPLTEVAAQDHTWADLAPVLDRGPRSRSSPTNGRCAAKRSTDAAELPAVLELPLDIQAWEPAYSLAVYTDGRRRVPDAGAARRLDRDHTRRRAAPRR